MSRICLFLLIAGFLLSASAVSAQTGKVEGRVVDQDGEPLIGVNVVVEGTTRGASTDLDGYYFILNVRPGTFNLVATYLGFDPVTVTDVSVSVDRTTTINFEMFESGLMLGEITVSAQANMITRDRTSASAKVSGEELQILPVDNFQQAVSLQAGVTRGQGGSIHIRGGRTSEVKYYVDGIAVSNPFNFGLSVPVENTAVQEVEVISGSFNAEFGQANSGIINIVTKEGGDEFQGTFISSVGGYISRRDDIYYEIGEANPIGIRSVEGSFSGPTPISSLKFFLNARYTEDEGHLFGRRRFTPADSSNFSSANPDSWSIVSTGDNAVVSMNDRVGLTTLGKLNWDVTRDFKLSYSFTRGYNRSHFYNHNYRLNPDFMPTQRSENFNHLVTVNHVLSNRLFYNLRFTANSTNFTQFVYEDPFDPRYRNIFGRGNQPAFMFNTGGVDNYYLDRNSQTYALRFDITRQTGRSHLIKAGFEYRQNELNYEDFRIQVNPFTYGDYNSRIQFNDARLYRQYTRNPLEISAYIQDKIEIRDLIINAGIRFDYFDPQSRVPTDLRDPDNSLTNRPEEEAFRDASVKWQFSPRLGFAFPITANGVIYASYGQFFQIPEFQRLYENPRFAVRGGTFNTVLGNADLEAQRSVLYEIGLQQQLNPYLALDLTVYHRDIRFLLGTELFEAYSGGDSYGVYKNADFGSVRGVTAAFSFFEPNTGVSASINYTYQSVQGNGSDPQQAFFDAQNNTEANSILIPLAWDMRHNISGNIAMRLQNWNVGIVGEYRTGYPFTPRDIVGSSITEQRNQARYNPELYFDIRMSRIVRFGDTRAQIFIIGENLLDFYRTDRYPNLRRDEIEASRQSGIEQVNTREEFVRNPLVQPTPRIIRAGLQFDF
ncbi:MAG: TonB-dependent receptor [Balneolales bacterium]|nr:TonB-dependent receptor [Balneolales bacterium]